MLFIKIVKPSVFPLGWGFLISKKKWSWSSSLCVFDFLSFLLKSFPWCVELPWALVCFLSDLVLFHSSQIYHPTIFFLMWQSYSQIRVFEHVSHLPETWILPQFCSFQMSSSQSCFSGALCVQCTPCLLFYQLCLFSWHFLSYFYLPFVSLFLPVCPFVECVDLEFMVLGI